MRYSERNFKKNTLIVGASCGVGEAVATALCEAGHTVIGASRSKDRLEEIARKLGPSFRPLTFDLAEVVEIRELVEKVNSTFGSYDIVNMAFGHIGEDEGTPLQSLEDKDIEKFCRESVLGNWYLIKYFSHQLKENGRRLIQINADWGFPQHNILLGSENSDGERIGSEIYTSAKHALTGLTNSVERLSGFESVGIYPGAIASQSSNGQWLGIDTPLTDVFSDPLFEDENAIPLKDIANSVIFALNTYSLPKAILMKPNNKNYDGVGI